MSGSVSRVTVKIKVDGVGEAKGEFVRILAPLTVKGVLAMLPYRGRAHVRGGGLSMIIGIRRGGEKAVRSVKAGDIVYWPMQDSLIIYFQDSKTYGPVNKVGSVIDNLDIFKGLKGMVRINIDKI
jgi:hypothetical protein